MNGINQWSIVTTKNGDVFKHSCTACSSTTYIMGKDQPVRAFCCGVWVTPQKDTFFTTKLPREQFRQPRVLEVPRKMFEEAGTE
jgi:hypothetical protein